MRRRLTTLAIVAAVSASVAWLWWDHLRPSSQGGGLRSVRGRAGLVVETPRGEKIDLSEAKGKIQVVHFWATWCPPCIEEMPELVRFWNHYRQRNEIALYAIATDKEGWEKVGPFVDQYKVDLPIFLDRGGNVAERFGTTMFPETYIVNRHGRVVEKVVNAVAWSDPQIQAYFDQLLASAE